ncbi:MAG: hypothetical protein KIG95_13785 [Comamonas sp.]|nr:hypothetical protein [Comamonas sp.]
MRQLTQPEHYNDLSPAIAQSVNAKVQELQAWDLPLGQLAQMWLVEDSDTLQSIEQATGQPLSHDWCGNHLSQSSFAPPWDVLHRHKACWELVYVLSDDGFGWVLWIPIDHPCTELQQLCQRFAT